MLPEKEGRGTTVLLETKLEAVEGGLLVTFTGTIPGREKVVRHLIAPGEHDSDRLAKRVKSLVHKTNDRHLKYIFDGE